LGVVAYTRQDLDAAEKWYFKSLEIDEKINDEIGMAETYCNLSDIAKEQDNNEAAEEWLRKALHIFEKQSDANRVIHLGEIAERRNDVGDAEKLYRKVR
jgi:tetratricopeptide (TPR) repeat protein